MLKKSRSFHIDFMVAAGLPLPVTLLRNRFIMHNYYVNKNSEGDGSHEVHSGRCIFLPRAKSDCIMLGSFDSCADAVKAATAYYPTAMGCFFCIHDYHLKNQELKKKDHEVPGNG